MTTEQIDQMQAGPELDLLIAEKVMKYPIMEITPPCDHITLPYMTHIAVFSPTEVHYHRALGNEGKNYAWGIWQSSKDIAQAWEVLEKLDLIFELTYSCPGWYARFSAKEKIHDWMASADTAPLAISRAALKAVTR